MPLNRLAVTAMSCVLVLTTLTTSAQASAVFQPETRAGLMIAAKKYAPYAYSNTKNCIEIATSASVIARGIAQVSFSDMYQNKCTTGAWQVWAYTGSQWKPLSVYMQNDIYYTLKLPGKIDICKGNEYTVIRSGPSLAAKVVGRVTANTSAYATKVVLTEQSFVSQSSSASEHDGLAWYQITSHGKNAWVGSSRTMAPEFGCKHWTSGRVLGYE